MATPPHPSTADPRGAASPDSAGPDVHAVTSGTVETVRSEERLRVGTDVRVSGRAVLRKYIVTETITQTFQVRHEEVRVDYEPATRPEAPSPHTAVFDDRVVEVVLHREVPMVQMGVVATERVRLHVDTVTDQVEVSAEVGREQVDLNVPDA